MLQSLADSFQSELDSLSRYAVRISYTQAAAVPLDQDSSKYDVYVAARTLTEYNGVHPLSESVGIFYLPNDNVFYNGVKKNSFYFGEQFYPIGSEDAPALTEFFTDLDKTACFMVSQYDQYENFERNVLIVAKPTSIISRNAYDSVIFFTIDMALLENWCSVFVPYSSSFAIIEPNSVFLMRGKDFSDDIILSDDFQTFLQTPAATRYPHEGQIYYKYQDLSSERIYLVAIPQSSAEEALVNYANNTKFILVVSVILLSILLMSALYINYKPILHLINKHIEPELFDRSVSELDLLDSQLFSQDKQLIHQEQLLTNFIIGDLLSGMTISQEDANRYFPAQLYCSYLVAVADIPLQAAPAAIISNTFEKKYGGKLVITSITNRPETVFVFASGDEINISAIKRDLQQIITHTTKAVYNINVGSVVTTLNQIQLSYYDALFANKQADVLGNNDKSEKFNVLLQIFEQQVASGDYKKALLTVDEIEKTIPELRPSAKWYCNFEIIHTYLSAVQKSTYSMSSTDIDHLISFKTDAHLFHQLRNSISNFLNQSKAPASLSQAERQKVLLNYVNQNYLDNSLCLTSVADYLQTSIYTVSRLFKEATGIGFKEYIINKRVQRACQLLSSSHMSVAEIAAACGFDDADYFTIVFKRKFGMPPTKYRDNAVSGNAQHEDMPVV